jgi:hypothetical protein
VDHAESVRNTLRKKWYPAVVRTFLRPETDEGLEELVYAKQQLFKTIGVMMTRQLRGLVEATSSGLAEVLSRPILLPSF